MTNTTEKIEIRTENVLFARYLESLLMDAGYNCNNIIVNFGMEVDFVSAADGGLPMPALIICSPEIIRKTVRDYNAFKAYQHPVLIVGYQDEFVHIAQESNGKKNDNVRFLYRPFLDEVFLDIAAELITRNRKRNKVKGKSAKNQSDNLQSEPASCKRLKLNKAERTASLGEKQVRFTEREFALLELLAERRGGVVSADEIARTVWKNETAEGSNVPAVYISYLRNKLYSLSEKPFIFSVRGMGYRIRMEI